MSVQFKCLGFTSQCTAGLRSPASLFLGITSQLFPAGRRVLFYSKLVLLCFARFKNSTFLCPVPQSIWPLGAVKDKDLKAGSFSPKSPPVSTLKRTAGLVMAEWILGHRIDKVYLWHITGSPLSHLPWASSPMSMVIDVPPR